MAGDPLQDPDFIKAHPADQHGYLMATDQDYAKAAPQDQTAYLNHLWESHPPQAPGSSKQVSPVVQNTSNEPLGPDAKPLAEPVPLPFSAAKSGVKDTLKFLGRGLMGSTLGAAAGGTAMSPFGPEARKWGAAVGGAGGGIMGGADMDIPGMPKGLRNPTEPLPLPKGSSITGGESVGKPITATPSATPTASTGPEATFHIKPPSPPVRPAPDPVQLAVRRGEAAKLPTRMPEVKPEPVVPQGPTRVNPEDVGQVTPQGPTRVNPEDLGLVTPQGPTKVNKGDIQAPQGEQPIGKVISPESDLNKPRVGKEGRRATWTNEDAYRLARQGNRDAISTLVDRGLELPPNARYVMGDEDYTRAMKNVRDSTKMGSTPIRQGGKRLTRIAGGG